MASADFPCTVPIQVRRYQPGKKDAYGNPAPGYAKAEQVMVFGVAVSGSEAPTQTHPEAAEHRLRVYAPAELGIGDRDQFLYQGKTFEVDGLPGNWDANPWWSPGLVEAACVEVDG